MPHGHAVDSFVCFVCVRAHIKNTTPTSQYQFRMIVGGTSGHVVEDIQQYEHLVRLYKAFRWKPISRCTGRYTCRDHQWVATLRPFQLLHSIGLGSTFDQRDEALLHIPGRADLVIVLALDTHYETGIISYVKQTGDERKYVHTLNTPSGFRRKLSAIGVSVTDKGIFHNSVESDPHVSLTRKGMLDE